MTFYTPDVYNGPGDPGSSHQIQVVSGDESSSKHVCYIDSIALLLYKYIL